MYFFRCSYSDASPWSLMSKVIAQAALPAIMSGDELDGGKPGQRGRAWPVRAGR